MKSSGLPIQFDPEAEVNWGAVKIKVRKPKGKQIRKFKPRRER